ncbi:hypothetical protein IVB56_27165 [Bradyrhizobium sp. CW7]|uniref:hypothetical protein n=1 Tax=Bradyrhizobium sp. CW7 TaxID=2782688 RepID=UPI001FFBAF33|nr:hypothetical protein [Bradyrhizobium sp. CW7]MCK1354630.1 hypothetical protein [Bradyrhizobium sp. CW7]
MPIELGSLIKRELQARANDFAGGIIPNLTFCPNEPKNSFRRLAAPSDRALDIASRPLGSALRNLCSEATPEPQRPDICHDFHDVVSYV